MPIGPVRARFFPFLDRIRVKNLRRLGILDTAPDPGLDELVRLATKIAEMPIGALSLVDQDRQWFKARVGLDVCETARDISFCTYTIRDPSSPLVIPDATISETFRSNPLVTGTLGIRSYVGFPIASPDSGLIVGSLCVIDIVPRNLDSKQMALLNEIARSVSNVLARQCCK